MTRVHNDPLLQVKTTCGTLALLHELQQIWDEVGETDDNKDKMLHEIEQECLDVYRKKVDQANRCKAQLRASIDDFEAQLAAICSVMGEQPARNRQVRTAKDDGSLKEKLEKIIPRLEEMRERKSERRNQFLQVIEEIRNVTAEIDGSTKYVSSEAIEDETDLSLTKLEQLHRDLHELQKEKSDRLKQIQDHLNSLNSLCSVLGMDFKLTVNEIHPSLSENEGPRSISNRTMDNLTSTIRKLRDVKIQRMQRLQDLATSMLELWNLMDTPIEEQQKFQKVTCNIAALEDEFIEPNSLSNDFINHVAVEVSRLEELKSSRMKELVLKKHSELEDICKKTHLIPEFGRSLQYAMNDIDSGNVDASSILEKIELQIAQVKEEALSRKELLEKVEKWLTSWDEESWLEEYDRDENRYNLGKGTHLALKRAEKARVLVSKLPGMVEALTAKTVAWEKERGAEFFYDGSHLISMLDEYTVSRQEREQERRRLRDQKKLQGQLIAEKEVLYGSKSSLSKSPSIKKSHKCGPKTNMLNSLSRPITPKTRPAKKADQVNHLEEENLTSKAMLIPSITNPVEAVQEMTMSVPMQIEKTSSSLGHEAIPEGIEYSFEEKRLASMLSKSETNSTIKV